MAEKKGENSQSEPRTRRGTDSVMKDLKRKLQKRAQADMVYDSKKYKKLVIAVLKAHYAVHQRMIIIKIYYYAQNTNMRYILYDKIIKIQFRLGIDGIL